MSLTSALNASVAGLQAQSRQLSAISENIANTSTTAYKGRDVHFEAIVTNSNVGSSGFSTGSVITSTYQNVDQQGLIENTGIATEIALNGAGFFVVSDDLGALPNEYQYSRNGDFSIDADGNLVNNEGYYLYGQRTDENGNIIASNTNDLNSLQPVNVNEVTGTASATTEIELDANLPADLQTEDTPGTFVLDTSSATIDYSVASTSSFTLAITDDFGVTTNVTINLNDPTITSDATLAAAINASDPGISASYDVVNDQIIISTVQGTDTVVANFNAQAQTDFGVAASGTFQATDPTLPTNYPYTTTVEIFDSLGVSHSYDIVWIKDTTTPNTWTATLSDTYLTGDPAKASTGTITTGGALNDNVIDLVFNGNGTLQYADGNGDGFHDTNGVQIEIVGLTASTGANDFTIANGTAISMDFGIPDQTEGVTQFSSNSSTPDLEISLIDQDGVRFGELSGFEINEQGLITALFDNGLRQPVYRIPVATFPNAGGLTHVNGTVYDENQLAGNLNLRQPGSGSAGTIVPNSLELSTTDTAQEFNKMIVAQQAYSASSQVLSTTDEMFDTLIQAVR
jgi:flagellar hook protein FlgE